MHVRVVADLIRCPARHHHAVGHDHDERLHDAAGREVAEAALVARRVGAAAGRREGPLPSSNRVARARFPRGTLDAFARAADDIADNKDLAAEDKLARLKAMASVLEGQAADDRVAPGHPSDLRS